MAMDHPKISIITTVYKTGHYLPLTVQSILAQTFTDFELLLVDDGSPDNSGEVADALAKTDARIRAQKLDDETKQRIWLSLIGGDQTALALKKLGLVTDEEIAAANPVPPVPAPAPAG